MEFPNLLIPTRYFHCRMFKWMQQKRPGEILVARNFTVFLYCQLDPLSFSLNTSKRLHRSHLNGCKLNDPPLHTRKKRSIHLQNEDVSVSVNSISHPDQGDFPVDMSPRWHLSLFVWFQIAVMLFGWYWINEYGWGADWCEGEQVVYAKGMYAKMGWKVAGVGLGGGNNTSL